MKQRPGGESSAGTMTADHARSPRPAIARRALYMLLAAVPCQAATLPPAWILDLSLEELGELRVTSVSKKEQRLSDAPAAIFVITEHAIRKSGVRSLPEALRLAPNLQVARINANSYAISARGFNSSTANKLLVMIDGRTIYTPLYSGVFWDVQDVLLEDVARIEVISGPGGTLWGTNAVNGVINIISKRADASHGNLAQVQGGSAEHGVALRHSGSLSGSGGSYRIYAKGNQGLPTSRADGSSTQDGWARGQLGFRADWEELTVQGDAYRGSADQSTPGQQATAGANLLLRWTRPLAHGSSLRIRSYLERTTRDIAGTFNERLNTFDFDMLHTLPQRDGVQTLWGAGYRISKDHVGNSATLAFLPPHRTLQWGNLFAQQERDLSSQLRLSTGLKLESNDYTGVEWLPSVKLAWKPADDQLIWTGFARAVRAPSRIDTEFNVPGAAPYLLVGNPDFRSEIANTLELGWRGQASPSLSYSLAIAHNEYKYLRSLDSLPGGQLTIGNRVRGQVDVLELWGSWRARPTLQFNVGTVLLEERFSGAENARRLSGNDPRLQWRVDALWSASDRHSVNLGVRHVGKLPAPAVPAYTSVDINYIWKLSKQFELAVGGRNLFNPHHQEFASGNSSLANNPVQIERAFDLALTASF